MKQFLKKIIVAVLVVCMAVPIGYASPKENVSKAAAIGVTSNGGQYYCTECGYIGDDQKHSVVCTGTFLQNSDYYCSSCNQSFSSYPGRIHEAEINYATEYIGYVCYTCHGRTYTSNYSDIEHDTSVFAIEYHANSILPLRKCTECGEEVYFVCYHTGDCDGIAELRYLSSYTCDACGTVSKDPSSRHTKICSGVMVPYVTITYDMNGGSGGTESGSQIFGNDMIPVTIPEKSYTVTLNANGGNCSVAELTAKQAFAGYYSDAKEENQYVDKQGKSAKKSDFTEDTKLYARWENTEVVLPAAASTGRTFEGWSTDTSEDNIIGKEGDTYTPTGNATLYAIYSVSGNGVDYSKAYDGVSHGIDMNCENGSAVTYGTTDGNYDLPVAPKYTDVGTYTVYWKISKKGYVSKTGYNTVTITKADPVISYPNLTPIISGQKVSDSVMTNGSGDGVFSFVTPDEVLTAGTYLVTVRFTPNDTKNYNTLSSACKLTVDEKTQMIATPEVTTVSTTTSPASSPTVSPTQNPTSAPTVTAPAEGTAESESSAPTTTSSVSSPTVSPTKNPTSVPTVTASTEGMAESEPSAPTTTSPVSSSTVTPPTEETEAPSESSVSTVTASAVSSESTNSFESTENLLGISEGQSVIPLSFTNSQNVPVITITKKIRAGTGYSLKNAGVGEVTYKSSKNKIAKIIKGKKIKALKKGKATITAFVVRNGTLMYKLKICLKVVGKKDRSCKIYSKKLTASQKKYKGIKMFVSDIALKKGSRQKIKVNKKGYTVKYKTTNKKVAKAAAGVIRSYKKGSTRVTIVLKKGEIQIKHIINIKVI